MCYLVGLLLLRSRPPLGLFLGTLAGCRLHSDYFDFRHYVRGTRVMVLLVPPGRFVVAPCIRDVVRPLLSTHLIQVVRVVSVGCDNFAKLDIIRPSTKVRTTRY
jgi:hypothetical protein